jgi:murein DD-endopeptidase MepM/ murein hydrolase activator NlpD
VSERTNKGVLDLARIVALLSPLTVLIGCIPSGSSVYSAQQSSVSSSQVHENALDDTVTYSSSSANAPAPAPQPVWEARSVNTNAVNVVQGYYTVQPGDTLRGIGNLTGAGSEILAQANGLEPPYTIFPGQRLTVPAGLYHTVGSGETGIAIARAYGVSWSETVALNGLEEPYILRLGQKLRLPSTGAAAVARDRPLTPEERAAAFTLDIDDVVTGSQPALADGTRPSVPSIMGSTAASSATLAIPASYNGRFVWPLRGSILTRFGAKGKGQISNGIDIAATQSQPIAAAGDGVVSYAGNEIPVFGGLILISHGSGWVTAYGHAESLDVVRGQSVRAGQIIGRAGASGFAERPQLHFEIRKDRQPVDPLQYLPST